MSEASVSRETRALADHFFGAGVELAYQYADLLAGAGVARGLIGPGEAERLWDRHLFNCAALAPPLPSGATVVDIGSGAGLPGLVLAIARADLHLLLVEPLQRRAEFLREAVVALELRQVDVRRARAEELHGELRVDWVTARAVAPLGRLAQLALPLLKPGGTLVAIKGAKATAELAAAENILRRHGAARWAVETWGGTMLAEPTSVVRITMGEEPASEGDERVADEHTTAEGPRGVRSRRHGGGGSTGSGRRH